MDNALLHRIPVPYPSPKEFRPECYLENPRLMKYQLNFSRGSRSCLGVCLPYFILSVAFRELTTEQMNLAYQELYLILAGIFRRYNLYDGNGRQKVSTMELYCTSREDIDFVSDFLTPGVKEGSEGVRVL